MPPLKVASPQQTREGVLSFIIWREWPVSVTLAIVAWVLDTMRRSRTAALYVNGGAHPGAR